MRRSCFRATLFVTLSAVAACESEVRIEDGGGDRGTDDGGESSSSTGAGPAGAGGGSLTVAEQIEEACSAMCLSGCGKKSGCTEDCLSGYPAVLPECADEVVALLGCLTKQGDTLECPDATADCYDQLTGYFRCQNPFVCGSTSQCLECVAGGGPGCACSEGCEEGHVAGASCAYDVERETEVCDCTFDGVVVGQCENDFSSSCDINSSVCCAPLWR